MELDGEFDVDRKEENIVKVASIAPAKTAGRNRIVNAI